jgi:energy-coupling factor transport system substrate-specific component
MTEEVSRQINRGWTTRDIMVTAIISIALGILYLPLTYITGWLTVFPFIAVFTTGVYYWPIIMMAYLIRRPGVALFSALIIFVVQVPFTPWGILMLGFAFLYGIPIEIVLLVQRYKNFKLWYLMLTGAIAGLFSAGNRFVVIGLGNVSIVLQITYFAVAFVCGAIIGGGLAKLVGDAVIKTGVIPRISGKPDIQDDS